MNNKVNIKTHKPEQANHFDPYEPRVGPDFYSEVASRIIAPDNCPYLIYGIGVARSGTTVSLNVMASSTTVDASGTKYPIQCGYQHFKAGYRHAMHGWPNDSKTEPWDFRIPEAGNHKVFYTKDAIGPYTKTESVYSPLKILKLIEFPRDNLFLLFLFRDPMQILASWKRNWAHVRDQHILRENLITSCHTLRTIHKQAKEEGYNNCVHLYESIRDHDPETVISRLFRGINEQLTPNTGLSLAMTDRTVAGWDTEKTKQIWFPDEPAIYTRPEIATLHKSAKTRNKLEYKKYGNEELLKLLSSQDLTELDNGGAYTVYEYFRSLYVESTDLELHHPERLRKSA